MCSSTTTLSGSTFSVSEYNSVRDVQDKLIQEWRTLEDVSLEDNAYLSPDFIIPALTHLAPDEYILFEVRNTSEDADTLAAIGIFQVCPPSFRYPFRYLSAYQSIHSYLSGLLVDSQCAAEAIDAFFTYLKNDKRWSAVMFSDYSNFLNRDAAVNSVLLKNDIRWHEIFSYDRAILKEALKSSDYLKGVVKSKTKKSIARNHRKLEEYGKVDWLLATGESVTDKNINDFIDVEHSGWKKQEGTSLASNQNEREFFSDMMRGFARRGQTFFCELKLDGKVICSTSNIISGDTGFALKIGRNEEFDKYGIGMINECMFIEKAHESLSQIDFIDSGSQAGSYIENIWKESRSLSTGFYPLNWKASACLWLLKKGSEIKDSLRQRVRSD